MNIAMAVHDMQNNALGRAFSLALATDELGHETRVVGPSSGGLWDVLAGTAFAERCQVNPSREQLSALGDWCDAVISVKALPDSLRTATDIGRRFGVPVVLDMDDPDLEVLRYTVHQRYRKRRLRRWRASRGVARLASTARSLSTMVSNPMLQEMYGGVLVPHCRRPGSPRPFPDVSDTVTVGFIGTPRAHKGLNVLREAVTALAPVGFRLVVTARPPADGRTWEKWTGPTSLDEGLRLLESLDVVVVPSLSQTYGPYQLPVKLIDAMMSGVPVVASDLGPIRWALGDAGILVPPGSSSGLVTALSALSDPGRRMELGTAGRRRGLQMFTPEAVAVELAKLFPSVSA